MDFNKKDNKKKIIFIIMLVFIIFIFLIIKLNKDDSINNTKNDEHDEIKVVSNYKSPIVPQGFKKIETETASWELDEQGNPKGWNDGLVIEDEKGNQFVWVPYDIESFYEISNELIIKYSGFYIARYEAGLPEELSGLKSNISEETNNKKGKPVSKKDVIPWNYININNANYNAENMYEKNSNFKTELVDTTAYGVILDWIMEFYPYRELHSNISSSKFNFCGYYSTDDGKNYNYGENVEKIGDMILSTGASERNKFKNIYDFWGNVSEACVTKISEYGYIYAKTEGDNYKMNFEHYYNELPYYNANSAKGFRVVLYLY